MLFRPQRCSSSFLIFRLLNFKGIHLCIICILNVITEKHFTFTKPASLLTLLERHVYAEQQMENIAMSMQTKVIKIHEYIMHSN